jgi:hypothetical protein
MADISPLPAFVVNGANAPSNYGVRKRRHSRPGFLLLRNYKPIFRAGRIFRDAFQKGTFLIPSMKFSPYVHAQEFNFGNLNSSSLLILK